MGTHIFQSVCGLTPHGKKMCYWPLFMPGKNKPCSHSSCLGTLPPVCPCPWQWQMIRTSQGLWGSHLGRESPWLLPVVLSICLAQSRQQRQLSYFNTLLLPTLKCAAVNGNIPANSAGRAYKELAVLFREEMQFCFRQCVSLRCVCVCVCDVGGNCTLLLCLHSLPSNF